MTQFGPPLGADFAGFYNAGGILNREAQAERDRLYDVPFQDRLYHELVQGLAVEKQLPFVYPPFVALGFSYLAHLPYEVAFTSWLVLTALWYVGGLFLLRSALGQLASLDWLTVFLLALSFEPFVMECWIGGQLSAFGFLCLSAALFFERMNRPIAAGAALGLLLYKPTLLLLILPFLIVSGRWRACVGFVVTAVVLAALSYAGAGATNCREYLNLVLDFARTTTGDAGAASTGGLELPLWKYVDLNSFSKLLFGSSSPIRWVLIAGIGVPLFAYLLTVWFRTRSAPPSAAHFVWAATLTGTLVLNVYVGIYDAILLIPAVLMGLSAAACTDFRALLCALYIVPWVTQPIAKQTGVQLYALLLLVTTVYFLRRVRMDAPGTVMAKAVDFERAEPNVGRL